MGQLLFVCLFVLRLAKELLSLQSVILSPRRIQDEQYIEADKDVRPSYSSISFGCNSEYVGKSPTWHRSALVSNLICVFISWPKPVGS